MGRNRVELFDKIRTDHATGEYSIRALADLHGVHRRTVRQALESSIPPPRKTPQRAAPKLGPVASIVDQWLRDDLTAPRKQRHTARRIWERLIDEHGLEGLSYSTVRDHVAKRRQVIAAEAGASAEVFIVQQHLPGAEGEVDFAELYAYINNIKEKLHLFTLRLSCSGRAVHVAFRTEALEAFCEGHVIAFERLGGMPERIRYDNLKVAVSNVLMGRERREADRWIMFRSHYGFDAFYCRPGVEGAHEKGGVEGEGGRFRRRHCVPIPHAASLEELNAMFAAADAADDARRIGQRPQTVGQMFALEAPALRPLPTERFETGIEVMTTVDRHARVTVRQIHYSVPAKLIGRRLRVIARASEILVFDGRHVVARHERSTARGSQHLQLDHYLEVLSRKPGALPGSLALEQARKEGLFTATHEAWWAAARAARGDSDGTRALIDVLLLHRHLPSHAVLAGIRAALTVGAHDPDVVSLEARRAARGEMPNDETAPHASAVAHLPVDVRPLPDTARYDELLTHHPRRKVTT